jgi:Ca-activated chloride channel family protein
MQRHVLTAALLCTLAAGCSTTTAEHDMAEAAAIGAATQPHALPPLQDAPMESAPMERQTDAALDSITVTGSRVSRSEMKAMSPAAMVAPAPPPPPAPGYLQPANTENYAQRIDNPVQRTTEQPLSTFSIDVDTGSYANVRRMLTQGVRPPADAVRAEEFINYFDYGHPAPTSRQTPFRVTTELAPAPWNAKRQLLMIGIKGYDVPKATLPPSNLVFLIDTSGSMNAADKLPLLKQSFAQLVPQLRAQDRVSIVVYAGSAGLVLPPTPGDRHGEILAALEQLQAGGSTNGGQGIQLAYAMAKQALIPGGVNRVLLATDGDFNVGTTSQEALETLVGDQRKSGIALSTLGFGSGNYNDAMAEQLADVGDGNHAYIDTLHEARKVLVDEMQSTLLTIARDVKIQVEFNPAQVAEYRLIGYENRVLAREDFANDRVDAGDIGAGHEVTALYEITPAGSGSERLPPLRYADAGGNAARPGAAKREVAHLRLRYKLPASTSSRLIETPIAASQLRAAPGESMRFAAAVAAYADALRGGTRMEGWTWNDIAAAAGASRGRDQWGERAELLRLIQAARAATGDTRQAQVLVAD